MEQVHLNFCFLVEKINQYLLTNQNADCSGTDRVTIIWLVTIPGARLKQINAHVYADALLRPR